MSEHRFRRNRSLGSRGSVCTLCTRLDLRDVNARGLNSRLSTLGLARAGSGTVKNVVNKSIRHEGQAREIVIDARGTGLSEDLAKRGAGRALGASRGKLDGLSILGDGYFFRWTPR